MDFTLALTHFCEVHGPKSVLCTQVLPLECEVCVPPPPHLERQSSLESYTTQVASDDDSIRTTAAPGLRRTDTNLAPPPTFPKASPAGEGQPSTPHIEQHPLFRRTETSKEQSKYPYGRSSGDTCASCTFTVPQKVAAKLPEGAPGSLSKDGSRPKNGAPVLRSREFVCLGKGRQRRAEQEPGSSQDSQVSSVTSYGSAASHSDCHDHTLTYLTSKSPDDPENYAQLRASVLRTLSCEILPRGMSEGPFCFGDPAAGYTIAYVFRLSDPKARGKRRAYAFVALAGNDAHRAFKACPIVWEAFTMMSKTIEQAAQKYQDEQEIQQQKEREGKLSRDSRAGYTNVSSFLTQRPRDPDGQPRRAGQTQPRSLAEIIGDENIFAILHQYFVAVLRCLGDKFGGLPLADVTKMVYRTIANEEEGLSDDKATNLSNDMLAALSLEEDEFVQPQKAQQSSTANSPSPQVQAATKAPSIKSTKSTTSTDTAVASSKAKDADSTTSSQAQVKRNSQCAPLGVDANRHRRVAV